MDNVLRGDLNNIADYLKEQLDFDVRVKTRTRKKEKLAVTYLFYVLAEEYTRATLEEMGEFTRRHRTTVYSALTNNRDYAKQFYPKTYKDYNPFRNEVIMSDNPFGGTISKLVEARQQLEYDLAETQRREQDNVRYMLRQVRNQKTFEILKLTKGLNAKQLDTILERLPPIIKMAQEFN